jgi:hypothetical protein
MRAARSVATRDGGAPPVRCFVGETVKESPNLRGEVPTLSSVGMGYGVACPEVGAPGCLGIRSAERHGGFALTQTDATAPQLAKDPGR